MYRFEQKVNSGQVKLKIKGRWVDVRNIRKYGAVSAHRENGDDYYDYYDHYEEEEKRKYNLGYEQGYQAAMERMLRKGRAIN